MEVKFVNNTGAALQVTEIKVLAVTTLQDGESLDVNPETDIITAKVAPTP